MSIMKRRQSIHGEVTGDSSVMTTKKYMCSALCHMYTTFPFKMREKIFKLRQEREKRKDEEEKEEEEDDEELENKEEEEEEEEEESKEDKELQVKEISNDNEEPLKLPPLAPNVLQQQKASKIPFPYPLTTSQEIGWRSARPECKLERFGKWARPKKSILKHFNWTVYACP